jgi:hypothetical protein
MFSVFLGVFVNGTTELFCFTGLRNILLTKRNQGSGFLLFQERDGHALPLWST